MRPTHILVATLILLAARPGAGQDLHVELRDGQVISGQPTLLKDGHLFLDTSVRTAELDLDQILVILAAVPPELDRDRDPEPADVVVVACVEVTRGVVDDAGRSGRGPESADLLVGRILGGSDLGVRLDLEGVEVALDFERIERLLPRSTGATDRLLRLAGAGFDDRIWRRRPDGTLDGLAGVVERVSGTGIVLESSLGPVDFALQDVLAAVFAEPEPLPPPVTGVPVWVRLAGGSRFAAGLIGLGSGQIELTTRFAERLVLPLHRLASLVRRSGGVVPLSELDPVVVEEWPSLGKPEDVLFPWTRELTVSGGLPSLSGLARASALGVHANARLTFDIPARAELLRVTVGLADEVGKLPARGTVVFQVRVDGDVVVDTGVVAEEDGPRVLRFDVAGAHSIELLTLDGGDLDAADRALWADGLFLLTEEP